MPELEAGAQRVYTAVSTNTAAFPSPNPTMVVLLALLTSFQQAQTQVSTRVKGAAQTRNSKAKALVDALNLLVAYIQGLANGLAEADAQALIIAAGLKVVVAGKHTKLPISVENVQPVGSLLVRVNASLLVKTADPTAKKKKETFNFDVTTDGGKTFARFTSPVAEITLTGYAPMTQVGVRASVTLGKNPMGPWTDIAYVLVQ